MMTTSTTTTRTMKTVMGIEIDKIDREVLAKTFKVVFKKDPPKSPVDAAKEIALYFHGLGGKQLTCDDCKGTSPAEGFDACPYCGSGDDLVEPAVEVKSKDVVVVTEARGFTTKDLDASIARIRQIKAEGSIALYKLGAEIAHIYDNDLWMQRNDENGSPKYKSFVAFLTAEVEIHQRTAFRMMGVAKQFTAEQANKHGNTILRGLLAAPKEDREELLDKVEQGEIKGKRGLEAEVSEIRKRKGVDVVPGAGKSKRAQAATKASSAKAAKKKNVVTAAVPAGRKTVKLLARPLKKADPTKPAKTLTDHPWGKLECQNGTTLFFALVKSGRGELELTVEARRES